MVVSEAQNPSTFSVRAGNAKLTLRLSKTSLSNTVSVVELLPGISQVGTRLEDAKQLRLQHDELIIRFNAKRKEHQAQLEGLSEDGRKVGEESWERVFSFLEARKGILDQSVSFYTASHQLFRKLQQLEAKCNEGSLSADAENAKKDLERHQNVRKSILEATMSTLQEGQSLLEKLRKASMEWGSIGGSSCHATTSGCYHVEQQLVNLRFKKLRLEELWLQRKIQLEQCVSFMELKEEVNQLLKWLQEREQTLPAKFLASSEEECHKLLHDHSTVQHQFSPLPQRLKHFLSRLELASEPALAGEVTALKNLLLEAEEKVDSRSTELQSRIRNLHLLLSFFSSSREATTRLQSLAVMSESVQHASFGQAQAYTRLLESLYDATVVSLRDGELLQGRLQKEAVKGDDEVITTISSLVKSLEEKVDILRNKPPQSFVDECNKNKTLHDVEDKSYKLNSWLVLIAQTNVNKHHKLPCSLTEANDFLISQRSLSEEVRVKHLEAKELLVSLNKLLESHEGIKKEEAKPVENGTKNTEKGEEKVEKTEEDAKKKELAEEKKKEAEKIVSLKEGAEKTEKTYGELHEQLEKRSKLALSFILLLKRERQLSANASVLEDQLSGVHDERSCMEVTDSCLSSRQECLQRLCSDIEQFAASGATFLEEAAAIKTSDPLTTQGVSVFVESTLKSLQKSKEILNSQFGHWKSFVTSAKKSSEQWKKLLTDVRKTIEWVIKAEEDFFPKIAGELGSSLAEVQGHQKKLDEFKSVAKRVHEETEAHLKTSEQLLLEKETFQDDMVLQHLLTTTNRFQARISEYQHLLNVSSNFFQHLSQLDTLIATTEQSYKSGELAKGVKEARDAMEVHEDERNKMKGLIDATYSEGGGIVVRVRQEDAQEKAKDEVRRRLQSAERERNNWQKCWEEHQRKLQEGLVLCRFYFDLKQLQNELDLLQRQLDSRHGNYGTSTSSVQAFLQAFELLQNTAKEVGVRVDEFGDTAERMIKNDHYDSRRIRHEVDETQKRWKRFLESLNLFRGHLDEAVKFFQINTQCEEWVSEAGQFLLGVSKRAPSCKGSDEVEGLVSEIEEYRKTGGGAQDGRLKEMEVIVTSLYGQVKGPQRMNGVLEQTQAVYNAFIRTIEELRGLKGNLANTENILAQVEKVVDKRAPKQPSFIVPLQNAEITEGHSFTFECRLECDTAAPQVEWFREDEHTKGFISSYNNGLCQLHIEETLIADSATYTCQATTPSGSTKTSAKLLVKATDTKHHAPELLKHLRAAEVPEGTSHTFECCVVAHPAPTTQWFLNDVELQNAGDYSISNDQGRCCLKIKRLNKTNHTGKVRFKATNPEGEVVTSAALSVFAVKKPEFTTPLRDTEVEEGGSVKVQCRYTGQPPPQVQWYFNDSPILPSALFKITVGDDYTSLEIREVFVEDCGTYSVTASNLGGEAHTSCLIASANRDSSYNSSLNRQPQQPTFITPLSDKACKEGERVSFECFVLASPPPEISWFHNGKAVKQTKDFDFTYDKNSGRCVLHIHETYVEDSGSYVCQAKNSLGSNASSCRLTVEASPEQVDSRAGLGTGEVPPKFTQLLKDIEAIDGELVRFECRVIGTPAPLIKWFQGRNPIESNSDFELSSNNELQTLTIKRVHRHDAGNYMIKATNDAGIAKCYATLVVKHRSENHAMKVRLVESSHSVQTDAPVKSGHVAPEILKSFHDVHVRPGQPCNIEVVITGVPKPKVQWLFNNEAIVPGLYRTSCLGEVHSLHIPKVGDGDVGRFSVIAENDAGKAWCSALLVVVDSSQLVGEVESPPETPQVHQGLQRARKYVPPFQPPPSDLPPKFFAELTDISSQAGKKIVLEVLVEGRPEPLVTWYKDGVDLMANPDYEISCKDGRARLIILDSRQGHSGQYSCVAKNSLGVSRSNAKVTVEAPGHAPKLLEGLQPSTSVKAGDTVRLVVVVSGQPPPKVSWFREGIQIKPSPDFILSSEGSKHCLLLPRAYTEDSGRYEARLENTHGQIHTSTLLHVQPVAQAPKVAPKFVKPLHNMSVLVDQRATLECTVPPQTPLEDVQWLHNNQRLQTSPNHTINYEPHQGLCQLVIQRVTPACRGRYVCTVVINSLSKSTAMDLDVTNPPPKKQSHRPNFTEHLKNQVSDDSSDVIFTCRVQGQPKPSVRWLHNGQLLAPSLRHTSKYEASLGLCSLVILNTCLEDTGIYTCVASNSLGEEFSSAELKVRVKSPMPPRGNQLTEKFKSREVGGVAELYFKPVFKRVPADLYVPEGHVARFDCLVIGRPTPDVYWFREGVRVQEDWMHKIVINEEGINSIIFEATAPQDAGNYLCIARNRAGEDRFNVALNVLPHRSPVPPRFSYKIPNQVAKKGHPVTFTVEIEGIPQPRVTWLKGDQVLQHGHKYHILGDNYKTTLQIPVVTADDDSWYSCVASSTTGTSHNKFRLVVEDMDELSHAAKQAQSPHTVVRLTPSPALRGRSPSPSYHLVSSQRTHSETTMKTVHTGTIKSPEESVAAPELLEPMKDQLVAVGGKAHFKCRILSAQQSPQHQWYFENAPLPNLSGKYHTYEGRDGLYGLEINGVTEADAGLYKVTAVNKGGEVTCIAHLKVGIQPDSTVAARVRATPSPAPSQPLLHVANHLIDQRVVQGAPASFEVDLRKLPSPWSPKRVLTWDFLQVDWFLNDRKVVNGQDNIKIHDKNGQSTLHIAKVTPAFTGKVSCIVGNTNGQLEVTASLGIIGLNSPRGSVEVTSQQHLQHLQHLEYPYLHQPQQQNHQIQTQQHHYQYTQHQIQQSHHQHSHQSHPHQQQPPKQSHQHYLDKHQDLHSPHSTLFQPAHSDPSAPVFIKPLTHTQARDGSEVVLSCRYQGQPPVNVSWFHKGVCIDESQDFAISNDAERGVTEVVIVDCMQDDDGEFKCTLQNNHGRSETSCILKVVSPNQPYSNFSTVFDATALKADLKEGSNHANVAFTQSEVISEETTRFATLKATKEGEEIEIEAEEMMYEATESMFDCLDVSNTQEVTKTTQRDNNLVTRTSNKQQKVLNLGQNQRVCQSEKSVSFEIADTRVNKATSLVTSVEQTTLAMAKEKVPERILKKLPEKVLEKVPKNVLGKVPKNVLERELRMESKEDLKKTLKADLKEDDAVGLKEDAKNMKVDLKVDLKADLLGGLKEGLKADMKEGLKADMKEGLKADMKGEARKSLEKKLEKTSKENKTGRFEGVEKNNSEKVLLESPRKTPKEAQKITLRKIQKKDLEKNDEKNLKAVSKEKASEVILKREGLKNCSKEDLEMNLKNNSTEQSREEFKENQNKCVSRAVKEESTEGSPNFEKKIPDQVVMDGCSVLMRSILKAHPMPEEVVWSRNGLPLEEEVNDVVMHYSKQSGEVLLSIPEVFPEDAGLYECKASTGKGVDVLTVNLRIEAYEYIADSEDSYTSTEEIDSQKPQKNSHKAFSDEYSIKAGAVGEGASGTSAKGDQLECVTVESTLDFEDLKPEEDFENYVKLFKLNEHDVRTKKQEVEVTKEKVEQGKIEQRKTGQEKTRKNKAEKETTAKDKTKNEKSENAKLTAQKEVNEEVEVAEIKSIQESLRFNLESVAFIEAKVDVLQEGNGFVQERGGVTQEQNGITQEQDGITQEQNGITQEQDGITQEQNGISQEESCITQDQNVITQEQGGIIQKNMSITGEKAKKVVRELKEAAVDETSAEEDATEELFHNTLESSPMPGSKSLSSVGGGVTDFDDSDIRARPLNHSSLLVNRNEIGKVSNLEGEGFVIATAQVKKISYKQLADGKKEEKDYCLLFPTVMKCAFDAVESSKVTKRPGRVIKIDEVCRSNASIGVIMDLLVENAMQLDPCFYRTEETHCCKEYSTADDIDVLLVGCTDEKVEGGDETMMNSHVATLPCRCLPDVTQRPSDKTSVLQQHDYQKVNVAPSLFAGVSNALKRIRVVRQGDKVLKVIRALSLDTFSTERNEKTKLPQQFHLKKSLSELGVNETSLKSPSTLPKVLRRRLRSLCQQGSYLSLGASSKKSTSVTSSDDDSIYSFISKSSHKNFSKTSGMYGGSDFKGRLSPLKKSKSPKSNDFRDRGICADVDLHSKQLKELDTQIVFKMNSLQRNNFCVCLKQAERTRGYIHLTNTDASDACVIQKKLGVECKVADDADAPVILDELEAQEALDGSRVEMVCMIQCRQDTPTPKWFVDGVQITPSEDMFIETVLLGDERDSKKDEKEQKEKDGKEESMKKRDGEKDGDNEKKEDGKAGLTGGNGAKGVKSGESGENNGRSDGGTSKVFLCRLVITDVLLEDEGLYTLSVACDDYCLYSSAYVTVLDVNSDFSTLPVEEADEKRPQIYHHNNRFITGSPYQEGAVTMEEVMEGMERKVEGGKVERVREGVKEGMKKGMKEGVKERMREDVVEEIEVATKNSVHKGGRMLDGKGGRGSIKRGTKNVAFKETSQISQESAGSFEGQVETKSDKENNMKEADGVVKMDGYRRIGEERRMDGKEKMDEERKTVAGDGEPQLLKQLPERCEVLEGESLCLCCAALPHKDLQVTWHQDGLQVGNNDTRLKTGRKGGEFSLQIDHVALEDRALYACVIANNHGKVHSSTEVFVKKEASTEENVLSEESSVEAVVDICWQE